MTGGQHLERYVTQLKQFRRRLGAEDMRPIIHIEYDDKLVATIFVGDRNKYEALDTVVLAGRIMNASAVTLAFDAKYTKSELDEDSGAMLNPLTGKPWVNGEMQALAEDGAGGALGILDAVALVRVERTAPDRIVARSLPYRVAAGTVDFLPEATSSTGEEGTMQGLFADALRQSMEDPLLDNVMNDPTARALIEADGLTVAEAVAHARCAAVKILRGRGFSVALFPQSQTDIDVYCRSLGATPADFEEGRIL